VEPHTTIMSLAPCPGGKRTAAKARPVKAETDAETQPFDHDTILQGLLDSVSLETLPLPGPEEPLAMGTPADRATGPVSSAAGVAGLREADEPSGAIGAAVDHPKPTAVFPVLSPPPTGPLSLGGSVVSEAMCPDVSSASSAASATEPMPTPAPTIPAAAGGLPLDQMTMLMNLMQLMTNSGMMQQLMNVACPPAPASSMAGADAAARVSPTIAPAPHAAFRASSLLSVGSTDSLVEAMLEAGARALPMDAAGVEALEPKVPDGKTMEGTKTHELPAAPLAAEVKDASRASADGPAACVSAAAPAPVGPTALVPVAAPAPAAPTALVPVAAPAPPAACDPPAGVPEPEVAAKTVSPAAPAEHESPVEPPVSKVSSDDDEAKKAHARYMRFWRSVQPGYKTTPQEVIDRIAPLKGKRGALTAFFEDWIQSKEEWGSSCLMQRITRSRKEKVRGRFKDMTKSELLQRYGNAGLVEDLVQRKVRHPNTTAITNAHP
jgi:hypothetical protein